MAADKRALLAVRTIVVTTRAAATSHLNAGRADLAAQSAERGRTLLEDFRANRLDGVSPAVAAKLDEAESALESLTKTIEDYEPRVPSAPEP